MPSLLGCGQMLARMGHTTLAQTQLQCFQAHTQVQGGLQGTGAWPSGDSQTLETGQEPNGTQV